MEDAEPDLWERITSRQALQEAWSKVLANDGSPGCDGVTLHDFHQDIFANIMQLRAELLGGTYRTGPFRKVSIPKKKPGYRILTIPSVRDRVVHTSIATALTPIFEPHFEDGSFAYRPGRSVSHAVERIENWHKRGFNVVVEADIVSYFDNVDQAVLQDKIKGMINALPGAPAVLALIDVILADQGKALGTPGQGLVQGSSLSPLLAYLYLDALDEEIDSEGVKIVRFADDFVILCKSHKRAEQALADSLRVLAAHNLQLYEDGTRIIDFDKDFDFIGYLFLRSLALKQKSETPEQPGRKPVKSQGTDEGVIELEDKGSRFDPGRRILYVLDPSHQLATRNRSFSVLRSDGSELIAIPHLRIGRIEIGPGAEFSRPVIDLALDCGIELAILDGYGQTKGLAVGNDGKRATLQLAQARGVLDDTFRVLIGRRLVDARIRNQRTQLLRLNRGHALSDVELVLDEMGRSLRKVEHQTSIEALSGVEGATTAAYWPALGMLLQHDKPAVFRRTRPARDPVNAAINYLTAILERDTRGAIQSVGLHPGFAFLHGSRDRHDGLVYDLMEPFRAPLADGALRAYRAVLPDARAEPFLRPVAALAVVAQAIRNRLGPPDISVLSAQIEAMLDANILGVEIAALVREGDDTAGLADLSAIGFEKLAYAFVKAPKTMVDQMRGEAEAKVAEMTAQNPTRVDLIEKLEKLIDAYNASTTDVEETFERLKAILRELDEEERRAAREDLTGDE
jgi:CRISPR-associated protein Cas1